MSTAPSRVISRVIHPSDSLSYPRDMIWAAVGAVGLDRAVTLPYWGYEGNTIVEALGPLLWVALTVVALGGLVTVWFAGELWRYRLPRWLLGGITAVHLLVVVSNLLVIAGVL